MTRTLTIDPVTRIEGHAKITIQLDDAGRVQDAHFHVTQVRGFEKFVEGRPFEEMPALMARICGICPVSHLMASAKACDMIMAVRIRHTAAMLRRIMNMAQILQSHALSYFYLSAPDLMLGMDAPPAQRNIFGLLHADPDMARAGVKLRSIGQQIIEILGGKRIHPAWVVAGGVSEPLTPEKREQILAMLPEALALAQMAFERFVPTLDQFQAEIESFANFPTLFMGLRNKDNTLEFYNGELCMIGPDFVPLEIDIDPESYDHVIGETVLPYSYLKSTYYKPLGYPNGVYRVGPLARLNIVDRPGTALADIAFETFKMVDRQSSFHYHLARLIEIIYCIERIEELLNEPDILNENVRAHALANRSHGVGISEAPRGTLIHHYGVDDNGLMTYCNLIIATGHNNPAMDRGVLQVAQRFVKGDQLQDGMLNRVEAVIRAYDPCLSCSTHAIGQMPMHIQLLAPDGEVLNEVTRG
ncbi:MAG TPA: Ni/Fe hydrogenase subunit alpha [Candidatus Limnocylindrales bacterium]|nr:Ni/Fe hydrogenase subunit alpha [Candidatus Limnocylindrales bacterium]